MAKAPVIPLICIEEGELAAAGLPSMHIAWANAHGFSGQRRRLLAAPASDAGLASFLFGKGNAERRPAFLTRLAGAALAPGNSRPERPFADPDLAAPGFRLSAYRL